MSPSTYKRRTERNIQFKYKPTSLPVSCHRLVRLQLFHLALSEWVSGDRGQNVTWSTISNESTIIYHTVFANNQRPYQEIKAQAAWGNIYYAALKSPKTTFKTGSDLTTRGLFMQNGTLDNTQDTAFRQITE